MRRGTFALVLVPAACRKPSEAASTFPQGEVTARSAMSWGSRTSARRAKPIPAITVTGRGEGRAAPRARAKRIS